MTFELLTPTAAKLTSVNCRSEMHGKDAARKMQEAAAELDRLQARVVELEVDAERSAWLFEHYSSLMCTHQGMAPKVTFQACLLNKNFAPDMLRAAIDTARKAKP